MRSGDSVTWFRDLPDYVADDGWELKYRLLWPTGSPAAFAATGSGARHSVSLDASVTKTWAEGRATMVSYVERTLPGPLVERVTLGQSVIVIHPDLASAITADGRTLNSRTLDDLRAALARYSTSANGVNTEYTIGDRTMRFRSAADLITLIQHYEREVAKERASVGRLYYRG